MERLENATRGEKGVETKAPPPIKAKPQTTPEMVL